jgi:molecular chaperone HtpG
LRGAIDSPDIPLNVSRSFLQNDRTVRRIGDHIAKKVADRLNELYREDYEKYVRVWPDISLFMKFGAMNSDKFFAQIKDILIFRVAGSPADKPEYVTLKEYLERTREKQNKRVYYATDEAAQSAYIDLHRSQGLEVIMLDSWIDSHFSSFLEREYREEGIQFKRVDSELDEALINKDKAAELVDPLTQKTRSEKLVDLFRQALGKEKLQIKAEALKSESVPAMILLPETLRRLQELNAILQQKPMEFLEEHTLVVNTAHPLIQNLQALAEEGRDPELVNLICNHIYDLALITQKSFDPAAARAFVQRSNEVLTRLTRRQ